MKSKFPKELQVYSTIRGVQLCGDSRAILASMDEDSADLVVTSPPFALLREKSYGNESQGNYVKWLTEFGLAVRRVLKDSGSFILDLGGAYERGRPVRSLYNYRVLIEFCDNLGYRLAEEFFWYNPAKLPSPIEWVNKRKLRAKDAVNTVWWFSKTDFPKADVAQVLVPYSDRMNTLLRDAAKFYKPKERPSGHDISSAFAKDNGGAIPSNLLQIPNTESTSDYLRLCKQFGFDGHPARFPIQLPEFFIRFLTNAGDTVLDIFSGSNTTGHAAEKLNRKWVSIELDRNYAVASAFRFMEDWDMARISETVASMRESEPANLDIVSVSRELPLST